MLGEDISIWERFIESHPEYFDSVDYDWRVGEGIVPDQEWEENYKRMVTMLSQKRIDVVGWNDEKPTIVEVKKRGGFINHGTDTRVSNFIYRRINEFCCPRDPNYNGVGRR